MVDFENMFFFEKKNEVFVLATCLHDVKDKLTHGIMNLNML
jgi:hypothetical protein